MIDNVLMLSFYVFLDITYLCILIVTEVTFVFEALMLTLDVSSQRSLVNGHKLTELTSEPDPPVDCLGVSEERALALGHVVTLWTWQGGVRVIVSRCAGPTMVVSLGLDRALGGHHVQE